MNHDPTVGLSEWARMHSDASHASHAKKAPNKVRRDPGKAYSDALDKHKQMEAELSRALNRWQKSRAALHRIEKKLDILQSHHEE